jgi:glycopeptide antibiotics resistance protein
MALFVVVAFATASRAAHALGTRPALAWGLIVALGIVISATLTPLHGRLNLAAPMGTCDLSRIGLAPLEDLGHLDDTSLNILMFIPLGAMIALIGGRRFVPLMIGAIALPFAIELTQLVLPALERGCQSADVFDNLTGLVLGLALGFVIRRLRAQPGPN